MAKNDIPKSVKCSFCGKTQDNVRKIIAGPGVYICNECVGLCNEIIDAEYSDEDTYTLAELDEIPSPKEIKEILDEYVIGQEEAKKMEEQLRKQNFDLNDYLMQLRQVKKMGSFSSLIKMIPGMNQLKDIKVDDKEFEKIEAMICSMTKQEKRNIKILNGSRRQRIAKGSGTSVQEVNKFIKSFEMTQKMMKQLKNNKGGMKKLMKGIDENTLKNLKF